jgi:putative colanic acid biosynthesis glycosyltransferase
MRVLQINVNCKSGSTGRLVYDLYEGLSNAGISCAVAYGRGPALSEPGIYKFGSKLEVGVHALLTRLTGWTGCFSPFATRKLLKFIDCYNPDVIHMHSLHGYYVNIGPLLEHIRRKVIKTVWTFHCEFMYTGKCGISFNCDKWKDSCGSCPNLKEHPSAWFFDFTRAMFKRKRKMFDGFDNLIIVTPSVWLADRVKQSFLKDKKVEVISNGIDAEHVFYPRKSACLTRKYKTGSEKTVLAAAPNIMSDAKGGHHIVMLADDMKNCGVKFILIGVDCRTKGLGENVIALKRLKDRHELARYYSMADAFLMCSKKETFSLVCAEAICCGIPVVGFESGAPETIFAKPYARFVEQGNRIALKKALLEALDTPLSPEEISAYGRSLFDKRYMIRQYIDLYRTLGDVERG